MIVVGAGIVGAACAWALVRGGHRVTVLDSQSPGSGATAAGMGHIVVMDDSPAQLQLTRYSQELWRQLAPQLPAAAEYVQSGTLWLAADTTEMELAEKKAALYQSFHIAARMIAPAELSTLEPHLRPGLAGALLVPTDAVVYSPVAVAWMIDQVRCGGGKIIIGAPVTGLASGRVECADGETLEADAIVVATGTAISRLLPELPVRSRKGHLVITDRYPGFVKHQLVELGYLKSAHATDADSVAFNIQPRATGQLLIGSSRQYGDESRQVNHKIVRAMLRRAFSYMPDLSGLAALRTWTGFRAASPDHLPFIGPVPDRPGIYAAGGHEGLGITTSLGTAMLLADMIGQTRTHIDAAPYLPARFGIHGKLPEASHG